MGVSVVQPVQGAIERTRGVLFQPLEFRRWLLMGLAIFFTQLPELVDAALNQTRTISQQIFMFSSPPPRTGGPPLLDQVVLEWILANPQKAAVSITVAGLVYILIKILAVWVSSRGNFIFLDNVIRNQAAIREPWREFARLGNSLWRFNVLAYLLFLVLTILAASLALLLAMPDIEARKFDVNAILALVVLVGTLVPLGLTFALVNLLLHDFVIPVMYLRNLTVMAAWREFRRSLLAGHVGTFVLYILFKILISIVIGSIISGIVCATFLLASLPYVSAVVFLPIFTFDRCYSLSFIEQFGPQWQVFQDDIEAVDELGPDDQYPYEIIEQGA